MTVCAIGDPAPNENVTLKLGGIFRQSIEFEEIDGQPWVLVAGSAVTLVFGDPTDPIETWSAGIVSNVATFERTVEQVAAVRNTIRAGTQVRIMLTVPPDTQPEVKTVGVVVWQ